MVWRSQNKSEMLKKCAVIGSGIGGLAAAIRLAAKGLKVDVFETNNYPGGKLREHFSSGFRFDTGPSVFTMPHLIDELFTLCGKNPRGYFNYTRLDTAFNYFFEDGTCIHAYSNIARFAQELEDKTSDTKESFHRFLRDVEEKFNVINEVFIENSLHIVSNYFTRRVAVGLANFYKIDAFKTMEEGNKKFFRDQRLVQLFNNYALYVGSNPLVAPATLNLIPHLVVNNGTYVADHGMYSIVKALVRLAEEMGVTFHYDSFVEEIILEKDKAIGIRLKGVELKYDRIVSNMDVYYTYEKLLPGIKKPKRLLSQPKSSSIIGFYLGIKGTHPELGVHNMLFTKNEREEYESVFNGKTMSDDPSVYICITSKRVAEDAPEGCENWFILVTAPNDQGQDWDEIVQRTRRNVMAKINRVLSISLEGKILTEDVMTPPDIRSRYWSAFGAVFGNSSNSRLSAFLRHPNFSRQVKGLYFVGGSVHPGAGIPMCLNSAKIMDKIFD
jgi:phytoene desaturase